jgi:hypothetical protein
MHHFDAEAGDTSPFQKNLSEKYGKNYVITHQNTLMVRKMWLDSSMIYEQLIKKIGRKMKARKCA